MRSLAGERPGIIRMDNGATPWDRWAPAERPRDERLLAERTYAIAREAKALRENGDAEAALALLERVLTETPTDERLLRERTYAVTARAKALRHNGDAEAALALLERAVARTPQDERLLRERTYAVANRAKELRDNGDAKTALALLERALAETPRDERLLREWTGAIVSRARILRDDGEAEAALTLLERALAETPQDERLLHERTYAVTARAKALRHNGHAEAALALLERALAETPQDDRLLRQWTGAIVTRARILQDHGDTEAALALLERALAETPQDERLLRERTYAVAARAKALRHNGHAEAALALLERALAKTPQDDRLLRPWTGAIVSRARTLRDDGDAEAALALLERALAKTPRGERLLREWTGAIVNHAGTLRDDGDAEAALALLDQAMTRVPADSRLLALRANTLQSARRYEDALKVWRRLRDCDPLDPAAWSGMARSLYLADRPEQIEPLIDAYLGVLGDRWDRYVRAAYVAIAGRRESTFQALFERARAGAQDNPAMLRALAGLQLSAGGIGDALDLLDEARALAPEDETSITRRRDALRALWVAGVGVETLTPYERTALRMPDVALVSLLRRAPKVLRAASNQIVMVHANLGLGGIERQLVNTVRGLAGLEAKPAIVLMPIRGREPTIDWFRAEALKPFGVTIEPCQGGSIDLTTLAARLEPDIGDLLSLLPAMLRRHIGVLASRFLSDPPAVVHAWSDYPNVVAGLAAALAGVPRVILSSRRVVTPGTGIVDTYFHAVYRALLRRPGVVLVSNSVAGVRVCAEWLGTEPANIRVFCNGVDIDELEAARNAEITAAHRAELGLPINAKVVGSLMRLTRQKRPVLWLEAAAEVARRCPEAHFVVLGDGPMRDEMTAAALRLGIAERVHMPGVTLDVAPWYDLIDVVLLTSLSEGTANTALEAQALGVPVVSSDVGGMAECFVPDVSGFLASAEPTAEELAGYVDRAMTDEGWRAKARMVGPPLIRERFSVERMVRETLDLYRALPATGSQPV